MSEPYVRYSADYANGIFTLSGVELSSTSIPCVGGSLNGRIVNVNQSLITYSLMIRDPDNIWTTYAVSKGSSIKVKAEKLGIYAFQVIATVSVSPLCRPNNKFIASSSFNTSDLDQPSTVSFVSSSTPEPPYTTANFVLSVFNGSASVVISHITCSITNLSTGSLAIAKRIPVNVIPRTTQNINAYVEGLSPGRWRLDNVILESNGQFISTTTINQLLSDVAPVVEVTNILFDKTSWNDVITPLGSYGVYYWLDLVSAEWTKYLNIDSKIFTAIRKIKPAWKGITLNSLNIINDPSKTYDAKCGPAEYIRSYPILSDLTFYRNTTISFNLEINLANSSSVDWYNLLLHELGHALGFGINEYMSPYLNPYPDLIKNKKSVVPYSYIGKGGLKKYNQYFEFKSPRQFIPCSLDDNNQYLIHFADTRNLSTSYTRFHPSLKFTDKKSDIMIKPNLALSQVGPVSVGVLAETGYHQIADPPDYINASNPTANRTNKGYCKETLESDLPPVKIAELFADSDNVIFYPDAVAPEF